MAGFGYLQTANFAFSLLSQGFPASRLAMRLRRHVRIQTELDAPKSADTARIHAVPIRFDGRGGEPGIRWSVFPVVLRVLP